MRLHYIIAALLLLCSLALPVFAAEETPEALVKRVKELEKANLVLQEDLARTQLTLDTARTQLKTVSNKLDEEVAARKALADALAATNTLQKELLGKLTALTDKVAAMGADQQNQASGTNLKISALEKALADQAAKHDKDITDLRGTFTASVDKLRDDFGKDLTSFKNQVEQKIAALRGDLEKERDERLAADEAADKARAKIVQQQKKDRTITYIMGAVLGGVAAVK